MQIKIHFNIFILILIFFIVSLVGIYWVFYYIYFKLSKGLAFCFNSVVYFTYGYVRI